MMKRLAFLALLLLFPASASAQSNGGFFPTYPIPVPATQGGTGQTAFSTNCAVVASSSTALTCTTTPTLTGTNITGVPFSAVTGTVPVNQGGTNLTSYTTGQLVYASASGVLAGLSDVAVGQVLASGGVGTAPAFTATPTFSGANITAASIPTSALATAPLSQSCTTWTPADTSGASLTLTLTGTQYYCKEGLHAEAWFDVTYPSTANASAAAIGLPFTCQSVNFAGNVARNSLATGLGVIFNGTTLSFPSSLSAGTGGNANVTLSTGRFVGRGSCETTS
ncbi:MAG: hypothetical protein WCD38_11855 [Candidatus Tumulicola sp.]